MNEQQQPQKTNEQIFRELAAPFKITGADGQQYYNHKWKMQTNTGLCVPYIDSRQVSTRLNEVLGVDGWSDTLIETTGNYMICELTCYINSKAITKSNVGTPGNVEKDKSQASDALKRAAVKFGIGEYLYHMEPVKVNTVTGGNGKKVPATSEGKPLATGDALTSYINQKHPFRAKLTEIYNALNDAEKQNLSENFTKIWEALKK